MKKSSYVILFIAFVMLITGCQSTSETDENKVYTSIYPIQYIVEEIGGDLITTESVYPPGVDAHSYEPSSRDMTKIAKGDAFIYLGAGMESFAETAADSLENQDVKLVEVAALDDSLFSHGINHNDDDHDGHSHGDQDPHVWFDPLRMIQMGELIKDELGTVFPDDKEIFMTNFKAFEEKMLALDEDFTQTLAEKNKKSILVAHAAYGYWEERYGIEQIAISGLTTNDEPSQKELTEIVNIAEEHDLKYVIFEQTGTDKVSQIIMEQIDAEPLYMHNLESLTEDDIEHDENYITLMEKNLDVLDQATK